MFNWSKRQLGNYFLVRKIGSGGMSSVYKAIDQRTEKSVAIKVLPPGLDDEENFQARFEREAEILIRLRHPHIVPILDFGVEEGIFYIVMPLMEVGTLRERIRKGPIRPEEGANIIRQIAAALQFAHDAGMVHRDVKPSNILMDSDGNAWLSDFGTAHVTDATASLTGSSVIGTPQYMAPEQARGEPVSEKTDVYALGIMLYQMCTGQLPFDADTPLAIAMKHTTEPLPRPTAINPNIPVEVGKVLIRALEKRPEDRYPSAIALSQAFEHALELVYDPDARALKPGARRADDDTQEFIPGQDESADRTRIGVPIKNPPKRRKLTPVLLIGALVLIPSLWLLSRSLLPGVSADGGTATQIPSPTVDWMATVDSLSTVVASAASAGMSEEQVQISIAGTLQAMILEAGGSQELAAILPTDVQPVIVTALAETVIAQSSATTTVVFSPTASPTRAVPSASPGVTTSTPTSSSTPTPSPSPTDTPTLTPSRTPTRTATPSPTATSLPTNTPTPTVDVCALIRVGGFSANGSTARWTITNDSGQTITLTSLDIDWPLSNGALFNVFLKGNMVWSGTITTSPSSISTWNGPGSRQLDSSGSLELFFGMAAGSGYNLRLTFANGCQAVRGN